MDDSRTTTTSNVGGTTEHPTFYKVEQSAEKEEEPAEESMVPVKTDNTLMSSTVNTSTSSLSTLAVPPGEVDASPVCVSEAPQVPTPEPLKV